MNVVAMTGRITKDMTVRYVGENQTAVVKFVLAVPRPWNKEKTDFISCVAWGKTAETMGKWLKKGDKIEASGHIETDVYEKDGAKVFTSEFVVDKFAFGEKKREEKAEAPKDEIVEEELPFVF